ncbi:L-rhamnose mutarotase [Cryobacterium sp. Hh7]|uniref:L-rhamnose mutarotase n=1 Tax=Cryobacterium sp. Hh7 TaxID=1259159 RepID=UPI00106B4652|nr:L-rhamnose mutarotase [Cryobacterium sp. Hh7]TFD61284.1 L-rhamnose mutarotase [Cryobacterium sp. Hh7]
MQRACFQLQVKPDRIEQYTRRHAAMRPDRHEALKRTGWNNCSLFLRPEGLLIGYLETDSLEAAQAGMGKFYVDLEDGPDEGFVQLQEIFHLEDQLAALKTP